MRNEWIFLAIYEKGNENLRNGFSWNSENEMNVENGMIKIWNLNSEQEW